MLNVIGLILFWVGVALVSTFVMWRRLRDDYGENEVVSLVALSFVAVAVSGKLFGFLFGLLGETNQGIVVSLERWDVLGLLLGGYVFGLWKHLGRSRWWGDFQDALSEAVVWAVGMWLTSMLLMERLWGDWRFVLMMVCSWWGISGWYWLKANFRSFHWYESGRVGFAFWSTLLLASSLEIVFTFLYDQGWALGLRLVWSLGMLVFGGWGMFRLSGRKWPKEWTFFK